MDKIASIDFQLSHQRLQQERLIHRKEAYLEVQAKTKAYGEIITFDSIKESKRGV